MLIHSLTSQNSGSKAELEAPLKTPKPPSSGTAFALDGRVSRLFVQEHGLHPAEMPESDLKLMTQVTCVATTLFAIIGIVNTIGLIPSLIVFAIIWGKGMPFYNHIADYVTGGSPRPSGTNYDAYGIPQRPRGTSSSGDAQEGNPGTNTPLTTGDAVADAAVRDAAANIGANLLSVFMGPATNSPST